MRELTLFERLEKAESPKKPSGQRRRLETSLVRHLTSMLNTRKGSVPIAPDYGIGDVTDLGRSFTEESIGEFKAELERVLMRYEPRLAGVFVTHLQRPDTPLAAVFEIKAVVNTQYGQQTLQLETTLESSGALRVTEGAR